MTLTRSYRDSEMVVWFTSGQSLTNTLKPILLFSAPFLVAILQILRPGIEAEFVRDFEAFRLAADMGERFSAETAKSIALIQHVADSDNEMDALIELKLSEILAASPSASNATTR
jgi:lipopolysaccharide export LptBFGC system permease protein LptF